jgi:ParB-like nuclease domain
MAPTADTGEPRFSPTPAAQLKAITRSIQLVDIDSLRPYETPDRAKINEITASLRSSGVLINPVIVDATRSLLIDGHHRVRAFQELGLSRIPAFIVDYLSDDVTVRGWSRTTDARAHELRALLEHAQNSIGPWRVVAASFQQGEIANRRFSTASESAAYLDELNKLIRSHGHSVNLTTEAEALRSGLVHSYIVPVVGKDEVLDIVNRDRVFPYEVNRHLISNRPLEILVPLDVVNDNSRFRHHLDWILQESTPLTIKSGFPHRERIYEEQVVLFCATDRISNNSYE